MKQFPLLIKPASADCNLRCKYCFYIDHLPEKGDLTCRPRMSPETLERMISSYMNLPFNEFIFSWQGGEPTLMGLNFFKNVVRLQEKYGSAGATVGNGLQTNGVLINDEMAKFFSEYNFLLGISLDGPASIHDYYRVDVGGKGTHRKVMRGIDCLRRHNAEFNILCLVNKVVVRNPDKIYKYYREKGFNHLQFIPCVEYNSNGELQDYAITGKEWGKFLCRIFDLWKQKDQYKISIRLFDSILQYLIDGKCITCDKGQNCKQYFVIESSGDVFPCDFYVEDDLKLGNIKENSWLEMSKNGKYETFGFQKSMWNKECENCKYLSFCHGDCQRLRGKGQQGVDTGVISTLCEGWKMFYDHSLSTFVQISNDIKEKNQ